MSIEHQLRRINKSTGATDPYWTSVSTLLLTNSVAPASPRLGISDLAGTVTTIYTSSSAGTGPAFSLRSPFANKTGSYYADNNGSTAIKLGPVNATTSTYPTLNYAGNFTVELWTMVPVGLTMNNYGGPITNGDNLGFICGPNSTAGAYKWSVQSYGGALSITITSTIPVQDGVWRHLALVRNGTGTNNVTFYIDGVVIGQATSNGVTNWSNSNLCCGVGAGPGAGDNQYAGYIANVRLSNIARYTAAFTPPTDYFTVDANTNFLFTAQSTYAAWYDASNNKIPMQQGNSLNGAGLVVQTSSIKKFSALNSLQNSGTSTQSSINIPITGSVYTPLYQMPGDFTWETWVYVDSGTTQNATSTLYSSTDLLVYTNISSFSNVFSFTIQGSTVNTGVNSKDSAWHHLAVVRIGSSVKVYVDGTNTNTLTTSSSLNLASTMYFMSGSGSASQLIGYTDELRITKGVGRYTGNFTPPTAPYPTS